LIHGRRHVGYWVEATMRPTIRRLVETITSERLPHQVIQEGCFLFQ
jgi:hypothetical protein